LSVSEAEAPAAELLAQDAVLLLEVLEDLALVAVHPAGESGPQRKAAGVGSLDPATGRTTSIHGTAPADHAGTGRAVHGIAELGGEQRCAGSHGHQLCRFQRVAAIVRLPAEGHVWRQRGDNGRCQLYLPVEPPFDQTDSYYMTASRFLETFDVDIEGGTARQARRPSLQSSGDDALGLRNLPDPQAFRGM
jgi:hypothetical protein